eukprot:s705_g7.t1
MLNFKRWPWVPRLLGLAVAELFSVEDRCFTSIVPPAGVWVPPLHIFSGVGHDAMSAVEKVKIFMDSAEISQLGGPWEDLAKTCRKGRHVILAFLVSDDRRWDPQIFWCGAERHPAAVIRGSAGNFFVSPAVVAWRSAGERPPCQRAAGAAQGRG